MVSKTINRGPSPRIPASMEHFKDNSIQKEYSHIETIDRRFLELKQKYGESVKKCLNGMTEEDIRNIVDFYKNRAPEKITKEFENLTDEEIRDLAIKDYVIDNIIFPEREKLSEEEMQKLKRWIDAEMTEEDLLDKIFNPEK